MSVRVVARCYCQLCMCLGILFISLKVAAPLHGVVCVQKPSTVSGETQIVKQGGIHVAYLSRFLG